MQVRAAHHVALLTRNLAQLEAFYSQVLGLPVARRWDDVGIVFIYLGGVMIELIDSKHAPEAESAPGAFEHLALQVDDVDSAYAELAAKGVRMRSEPENFKGVRIAFFYDPDGNLLELVEDPRPE